MDKEEIVIPPRVLLRAITDWENEFVTNGKLTTHLIAHRTVYMQEKWGIDVPWLQAARVIDEKKYIMMLLRYQ